MDPAPDRRIFVAGTFNDWSPSDEGYELRYEEKGVWEARLMVDAGGHAFKFAVDGGWDVNWGDDRQTSVIPPLEGSLHPDGANILLNIQTPGLYLFRVNLKSHTWDVFPRHVGPGPEAAAAPRHNLDRYAELLWGLDQEDPGRHWGGWVRSRLLPGDFNGQFPLQDGREVVFLSLAPEGTPVAVSGTFNEWSTESHRMVQVPGVPLQALQVKLPPGDHHAYKFYSDGRWFRDPCNRLVEWDGVPVEGVGDFNSVICMPQETVERTHLLWIKRFYSLFLDNERDLFVMLPPGYSHERDRFPVLYVNDGNESITRAQMDRVAEKLMQSGEMDKAILVFIALPSQDRRNFEYAEADGRHRYARFLTRELVPFIDSQLNTEPDARSRGIIGSSYGGANAFYVSWHHPDVFGMAGAQGGAFHVNDYEVVKMLRDGDVRPVRFYLDSSQPQPGIRWGDNAHSSQMMARALQDRGYKFLHHETQGEGHHWRFWKNRFGTALKYFFPFQ